MWDDERFRKLSAAKPNAQTLWQRLLTGPELGCIPGLFAAREGGLADALGWSLAALRKCWKEIEATGMAKADWRAGIVWVPKAIDHNEPASTNAVVGWRVALRELPECDLKREAIRHLRDYVHGMGDAWAKAFGVASGDGIAKSEAKASPKPSDKGSDIQEQEQEQDSGAGDPPLAPSARASGDRPSPRPDILRERLLARDYEPLEAHRAYATSLGLSQAGYDDALRDLRDKHGGRPHDAPWLDEKFTVFLEQAAKPRPARAGASGGAWGESRAERQARESRERIAALEAEERASGGTQ